MINAILATKQEMTAMFTPQGKRMPVTIIVAQPNVVLDVNQNKTKIGVLAKKKIKKTENAFVKIAGFAPRYVREIKNKNSEDEIGAKSQSKQYSIGDKVTVSVFSPGDIVKVTGITKGKGFAGGVKRWGFAGGPKTHGQSDRHRAIGSIGQSATPSRVFKGKKMPGHMGAKRNTVIGLQVIKIDENQNLITLKGSVPGAKNGFLVIEKTGRVKNLEKEKKLETAAVGLPKEKKGEAEESKENQDKRTKETQSTKDQTVTEVESKQEKQKGEDNAPDKA